MANNRSSATGSQHRRQQSTDTPAPTPEPQERPKPKIIPPQIVCSFDDCIKLTQGIFIRQNPKIQLKKQQSQQQQSQILLRQQSSQEEQQPLLLQGLQGLQGQQIPMNMHGQQSAMNMHGNLSPQQLFSNSSNDSRGNSQSFRSTLFQKVVIATALICCNSINFLVIGMPFFKSEPHHLTCKSTDGSWQTCSKDLICSQGLSKQDYRANKQDSQYINNWVEQFDLLCESKQRVGFIGACYFIGVIIASSLVPIGWLSDHYGRKWIFILSMLVEVVACNLLLMGSHIHTLYISIMLLGVSHPGRNITALSYADEFLHKQQQKYLIPMNQLVNGFTIILTALYFQNIIRDIGHIQYANLALIIVLTLVTIVFLPESPKYLYSKRRYDEARQSLAVVAALNGAKGFRADRIIFETEKMQQEQLQNSDYQSEGSIMEGENNGDESSKMQLYNISSEQFLTNLGMMTGLIIIFSFTFWLIDFQQEFLGNDIYLNFYVTGFVIIMSGQLVMFMFKPLGLRLWIQIATSIMIVTASLIVALQQKWIYLMDKDEERTLLNISIPLILIFLSLACQAGYSSLTMTIFQDEQIFPFEKKATAINIILFVSKIFTIGAAFVNELNEPIPIIFIIVLACAGLLLIALFPTREEQSRLEAAAMAKLQEERSKRSQSGGEQSKFSSGVSITQPQKHLDIETKDLEAPVTASANDDEKTESIQEEE